MNSLHPAIIRACEAMRARGSRCPPFVFFMETLPSAFFEERPISSTYYIRDVSPNASTARSLVDAEIDPSPPEGLRSTLVSSAFADGAVVHIGWGEGQQDRADGDVAFLPRTGRFFLQDDPLREALGRHLLALPVTFGLGNLLRRYSGVIRHLVTASGEDTVIREGVMTSDDPCLVEAFDRCRDLISAMSWSFVPVESEDLWPVLAAGMDLIAGQAYLGVIIRATPLLIAADWIEERGGKDRAEEIRRHAVALDNWGLIGVWSGIDRKCRSIYAYGPGRDHSLARVRICSPDIHYTELRAFDDPARKQAT